MQKFDTPALDTTVAIRPADPARNRDTKAAEQIDATHGDITARSL
ncbi:hypothetical protein ACFYZ2_35930 [Streptomyces sviceus]